MKSTVESPPDNLRFLAKRTIAVCVAMAVIATCSLLISAQVEESGLVMAMADDVVVDEAAVSQAQPAGRASGPVGPNGQPMIGPDGKPLPANGKPAEGADGKPATDVSQAVQRPTTPPEPPDKKEFDIKPDSDGKIQFNFRNQPWPDLLRWLSDASHMSLDWQELPGDYVNLATTRPYTLVETRDLMNRLLLLRGYTLLEMDEVLMVTKTAGINSSLVPHVATQDLRSLPPNRFVRTSFPLDMLVAEEIVEELKGLMSSNGKLTALTSTNRLEGMDSAGVLSEISRLLDEEQSAIVRDQLAREFPLEFVRASEVKEQLEVFLGQKKSAGPDMSDPRQMQQFQQQMQQMQQMMQQGGNNRGGAAAAKSQRQTDVYLVANIRQNSVIVHAPPDKMAIVASFIERVDVANNAADTIQMLQTKMQIYRLASLDPKQLVATLLAMDALEPTTRLEVDETNKAVIAYASLSDQYAIQKVVERLDGSAREFEVLQLRRLNAEEVAGTIKFLMGVDPEDESDDSNSYPYYYYGSRNRDTKKKMTDKFRVGSNANDNQLLIWANDNEREEVNKLLVKLGEIPPAGGFRSKYRVIEAGRSAETLEYLKRLQEAWSGISDQPLVIPDASEFRDSIYNTPPETMESDADESDTETSPSPETDDPKISSGKPTRTERYVATEETDGNTKTNLTNTNAEAEPKSSGNQSSIRKPPPIEISFDENGNLVLNSEDTAALDRLEAMMLQNAPPKRPFVVFTIKNTRASWIVLNLKDYFKDAENEEKSDGRTRYYFYDSAPTNDKKPDPQLGKKQQMKFVYDNDTNTVLIRGADEKQITLITELIELWDTPTKVSDRDLRYTQLVRVKYSKAEAIVDAIKDAYRDLLSSNDKAFQKQGGEGGNGEQKRDDDQDVVRNGAVNFAFEGKLSLGVDSVTNSVLVSAQGKSLLDLIVKMVDQLDIAAKPAGSMSVIEIPSTANSESLKKALQALMNTKQVNSGQQNQNGGNQNNGNNANNGNGGGGRPNRSGR